MLIQEFNLLRFCPSQLTSIKENKNISNITEDYSYYVHSNLIAVHKVTMEGKSFTENYASTD